MTYRQLARLNPADRQFIRSLYAGENWTPISLEDDNNSRVDADEME